MMSEQRAFVYDPRSNNVSGCGYCGAKIFRADDGYHCPNEDVHDTMAIVLPIPTIVSKSTQDGHKRIEFCWYRFKCARIKCEHSREGYLYPEGNSPTRYRCKENRFPWECDKKSNVIVNTNETIQVEEK